MMWWTMNLIEVNQSPIYKHSKTGSFWQPQITQGMIPHLAYGLVSFLPARWKNVYKSRNILSKYVSQVYY